jgi:hypothetical protein
VEMSFAFNVDFEDFLKSDNDEYQFISTKKTQEFEYFILWLEEDPLYSLKKYEPSYLEFIKNFNKFKITTSKEKLKMWICEIYNKNEQRVLNSKIASSTFAIENNMAHKNTTLEKYKTVFQDGYLYKEEFGVSGIGTSKTEQSYNKLSFPLVKEPLLDRNFDFSTLFYDESSCIYQNHIDDYFQYKGTTIGLNFDYFEWIHQYKEDIQKIKNKFFSSKNPMSIDSFLYQENGEDKVYTLSEVNNRKTMGYCALKLKEKLGSKHHYARLRLFRTKDLKKNFDHEKVYSQFDKKVIPLSPLDNVFVTFLILEDSLGELNELEDLLVSTLFINF